MKVFPDTNVWLSGLFGHGLCARLLDELVASAEHDVLISEQVIDEFRRIALEKFRVPPVELVPALNFLQGFPVVPAASVAADIPDPDDAFIIGAALSAGVGLFVTGDKALLALGQVENLSIVSPREAFLQLRGLG